MKKLYTRERLDLTLIHETKQKKNKRRRTIAVPKKIISNKRRQSSPSHSPVDCITTTSYHISLLRSGGWCTLKTGRVLYAFLWSWCFCFLYI